MNVLWIFRPASDGAGLDFWRWLEDGRLTTPRSSYAETRIAIPPIEERARIEFVLKTWARIGRVRRDPFLKPLVVRGEVGQWLMSVLWNRPEFLQAGVPALSWTVTSEGLVVSGPKVILLEAR